MPVSSRIPRLHLFEWNDLAWVPAPLRDTLIEALSRALRWGGILRGLVGPFQRFLGESGAAEVLDLCAGAGGPARVLAHELRRAGVAPPRFILTDLFPRPEVWQEARAEHPGVIDFEPSPVDATRIPEALGARRARVIINGLHHFRPELARSILADAARGSAGVFIAEGFDRNPLRFCTMWPAGVAALLAGPVLSPRDRLQKALLTWATPAAFAVSAWDGFVSTLRVYTEAELRAMVAPLGDHFRWEYGVYRYAPLGEGYYFYGVPTRRRPDHRRAGDASRDDIGL